MAFRKRRCIFSRKRKRNADKQKNLPHTDHNYSLWHSQHNIDSHNNKLSPAKNKPVQMKNSGVAFNIKTNNTKKMKLEEHAWEEETLELDCESVVDDDELHKQPFDVDIQDQYVRHANTCNGGRERRSQDNTSNEEQVEFKSIHGLPVNVPFTLQYRSPNARKTLKSKMYIIVEQRVLSYLPVSSMNIRVQGNICEHTSGDDVCPFMKDIEEKKMSSWVDIQSVMRQFAINTDETKKVSSNFSDNCDLSNDPVVDKQQIEENYSESLEECMNTTRDTVMSDCSTNDMIMTDDFVNDDNVTFMSDGLPSNCNELCEVKMKNGSNADAKSEQKSNDISDKVCNEKRKLEKDEETQSVCQSERRSSRLRNRNYSINYRQFGGLNDVSNVSNLDVIVSESKGAGKGDKETSVKRKIKGTYFGKKKCKKQVNEQKETKSVLPTKGKSSVIARRMFTERQMLKRMKKERIRIRVKLSEHADKYTLQDHISYSMQDRGKEDSEKTLKLLVCTQCKKFRTENEGQMEKHIEQHLNGELTCKECNFHAAYLKEMKVHNRIHRKVHIKKRCCPICRLKCEDKKHYRDHLASKHNLSHIICRVCLKAGKQMSFNSTSEMQEHFLEQHKDLMHKCTNCKRNFRAKGALIVHKCFLESRNASKAPCEICGAILRKDSIAQHKNDVHFQIRSHPCPHCNYAAKFPGQLKKHIQARHEGIRSLHCDQCNFSCVRMYQLVSHQRTHTGVKPYKCDKCPYSAAWNVQLKDHKKLHSNPLGVECEICGVVVKRGASYSIHMKKEHNDANAGDK